MAVPRAPTFYVEGTADVLKIVTISRGPTAVKTQRPIISDDEHVVLKFRPRTSADPPGRREEPEAPNAGSAANDLSHYERPRGEPEDFGDPAGLITARVAPHKHTDSIFKRAVARMERSDLS